MAASVLDTVINLCKRRGLIYPAGEIYGGTRSAWDYGPLGVELKENIKRQWWRHMVTRRDDVVGVDTSLILPRQVWVTSGHVEVFTDPLVEPKPFSGLMKTYLGAVDDEEGLHYLRPETAQGIFVNFKNVMTSSRMKPPFGIANIGKSFRNEITPGNFIFRTREFFVKPGEDEDWHQYWIDNRHQWYIDLGIDPENLRRNEHAPEDLSHYSKRTVDIEYAYGFQGTKWGELEGIANRTDYDLRVHSEASGEDLSYYDQEAEERWIPYTIEPAAGLGRALMAFLIDAYTEDEAPNAKGGVDKRTVLKLDRRLAPVKVAVLPLSKKPELAEPAQKLANELREFWNIDFDTSGAIGRRYRRQDETGTPFCVTYDFDTLEDNAVTVRERDSMEQERVPLAELQGYLAQRLIGC